MRLPYDDPDATDVLCADCAAADDALHLPVPRARGQHPTPVPYSPEEIADARDVAVALGLA